MRRRDAFDSVHPLIAFIHFAFALVMPMLFMHPVLLFISFFTGLVWAIMLKGRSIISFLLKFILPFSILIALLNPVFNHEGLTILFYLRHNPITLESILYGVFSAFMLASVLIWFSCFNEIMTSDKIIYLFGRLIPSISLLISMVFRFVPLFKQQTKLISLAMRGMGRDVSEGNILKKAKNGLNIISALITWGLESSIVTADSMRSRGFGMPFRTNYTPYHFDKRDILLAVLTTIGIAVAGLSAGFKIVSVRFFPKFVLNDMSIGSMICFVVYALTLLLPVIINIREEIVWRSLKSKI